MRIRWKLLLFLLVIMLPPLLLSRWYAVRETTGLGQELATSASDMLTEMADSELLQTVELFGEALSDARGLLEASIRLQAREAARLLQGPPQPDKHVYLTSDFVNGAGVPGATTLTIEEDGRPKKITLSYQTSAFRIPPGLNAKTVEGDINRLSAMFPLFDILYAHEQSRMLWSYVGLKNGLLCTYPGHSGYPDDYDPRQRPWFRAARETGGMAWRSMVDAVTRQVIFTLSMPVTDQAGNFLGAAGVDIPVNTLLPDNDLSERWTDDMEAVIAEIKHDEQGRPFLSVVARRDYPSGETDWRSPPSPKQFVSSDAKGMRKLIRDVENGRAGVVRMPFEKEPSTWAYRPMHTKNHLILLIVPHDVVTAKAVDAENAVMDKTREMLGVTGAFTLGTLAVVIVLAFFASRAVTDPVSRLAEAAKKLAAGDLSARADVKGGDELADLSRTFDAMAPKLAERLKLKTDMELAMEVQQHLLPQGPPSLPGLDIAGASFPCDETGGDYYDYLAFSNDGEDAAQDVILGDVTGHGVSAALFMATGRALLRGRANPGDPPARLLTLVNALLCEDTRDSGRFITMFFLRLVKGGLAPGGSLAWVRAGHDPALLYNPAKDTFEELMGEGLILGIMPDWEYVEYARPGLAPGEILAIGTDGIWEAHNANDEMYGRDRFKDILRKNARKDADSVIRAVIEDVSAFQGEHPREDDITLVVIKAIS